MKKETKVYLNQDDLNAYAKDRRKLKEDFAGITAVVFEEGTTTIPESLFFNRNDIREVIFPSTLKKISYNAFGFCKGLKDITFAPNTSLDEIGDMSFRSCESLENLVIPETKSLGAAAFSACHLLKSVTFPKHLKKVGNDTFNLCRTLTEVLWPADLAEIGEGAFQGCGFNKIEVPDTVVSICRKAFADCKNLTKALLPDMQKADNAFFGEYVFQGCENLNKLIVGNQAYRVRMIDNDLMVIFREKTLPNGDNIISAGYFNMFLKNQPEVYIASRGKYSAHGDSIREAEDDLEYKIRSKIPKDSLVNDIKRRGYVTREDYRILTGACNEGIDHFIAKHHITGKKIPISELKKLVKNEYGGDLFCSLFTDVPEDNADSVKRKLIDLMDHDFALPGNGEYIERYFGTSIEVERHGGNMFDLDAMVNLHGILGFSISYGLYHYISSRPEFDDKSLIELTKDDRDQLMTYVMEYTIAERNKANE